MPLHAVATSSRLRWVLLAAGWGLFVVSLPAPAFITQPGWLPSPLPVYLFLLIMFAVPPLVPIWVSLAFFLLSPITMAGTRHGQRPLALRVADISLLFPWLLVPYAIWRNLNQPSEARTYPAWGFYAWAGAYTIVWFATIIRPDRRPRADRRPGFPVITGAAEGTTVQDEE